MYVPQMTVNKPSDYDPNLKIWENVHSYRDFYVKYQIWDVHIGCACVYAVAG